MNFHSYCFNSILGKDVKTVGIMTAENPVINNNFDNDDLKKDLKKFTILQMKGKFDGEQENPFLIFNITKNKIIDLGKKYNQKSIIFGKKQDKIFRFDLIENGKAVKHGNLGGIGDCHFTLLKHKFTIKFN